MEQIVKFMETQLINAVIGVKVDLHHPIFATIRQLKANYAELMKKVGLDFSGDGSGSTSDLTSGQMLLMGFNGLFEKLETDLVARCRFMAGFSDVPTHWKKVDLIKEARSLQRTAVNAATVDILNQIFFLRRLRAMSEFYHLAALHARLISDPRCADLHPAEEKKKNLESDASAVFIPSFVKDQLHPGASAFVSSQNEISLRVLEPETLIRPIKSFIADFVRKQLLGWTSQTLGQLLCLYISLMGVDVAAEVEGGRVSAAYEAPTILIDELCKKMVETQLTQGLVEVSHLNRGSTLIANYDAAWRESDLHHRAEVALADSESRLQRANVHSTLFRWVHEDSLPADGANASLGGSKLQLRQPLLAELQREVHSLLAWDAPIAAAVDQSESLEQGIVQRLKWGSGANPSLAEILHLFESTRQARRKLVESEKQTFVEIVRLANAILHFEAFRSTSAEAQTADAHFLELLQSFHGVAELQAACQTAVSLEEEALLQAIPMTEETDMDRWIHEAQELCEASVQGMREVKEKTATRLRGHRSAIMRLHDQTQLQFGKHHQIIAEVTGVLKHLAKYEEETAADPEGGVRGFMTKYKRYLEDFSRLISTIKADSFRPRVEGDEEEEEEEMEKEKEEEEKKQGEEGDVLSAAQKRPKTWSEVEEGIGAMIESALNLLQDTSKIYDSLVELAKPLISMQRGLLAEDHQRPIAAANDDDDDDDDNSTREKQLSTRDHSPTKYPSSGWLVAPSTTKTTTTTTKHSNDSSVATPVTAPTEGATGPSSAVKPSSTHGRAVTRDPRTGKAPPQHGQSNTILLINRRTLGK